MSHPTPTIRSKDRERPQARTTNTPAAGQDVSGQDAPLVRLGTLPKPQVVKFSFPARILIWVALLVLAWLVAAGVGYGAYLLVRAAFL